MVFEMGIRLDRLLVSQLEGMMVAELVHSLGTK